MKILAIIPARKGSKRLKNKNIMNLIGKPLIEYSIEHAKHSKLITDICITSNCNQIRKIASDHNIVFIKRPENLCTDKASSESALAHALDQMESIDKNYDLVVFLQCTSPIRRMSDIDDAINNLISSNADSLFSGFKNHNFYWRNQSGNFESVNYDYKNRKREQDFNPNINENGSIYIFKPNILRKENNRLGGKIVFHEMPEWASFQIDDILDFEIVSSILKNKIFVNQISD